MDLVLILSTHHFRSLDTGHLPFVYITQAVKHFPLGLGPLYILSSFPDLRVSRLLRSSLHSLASRASYELR